MPIWEKFRGRMITQQTDMSAEKNIVVVLDCKQSWRRSALPFLISVIKCHFVKVQSLAVS